jgi:phosphate transport system permease protein
MTQRPPSPALDQLNKKRRFKDRLLWGIAACALIVIVIPIIWIISQVVSKAIPHMSMSVLLTNTIGNGGGLKQAIVGSITLLVLVGAIAGVTGIGAGIYIARYAPRAIAGFLRSTVEILAGVPSIVVGFVGYIALVVGSHWSFSIWAATIVLSAMVVPYIAKATEVSLRGVSDSLREAGEAIGLRDSLVLRKILIKSASPGIVTGFILALAISVGETAPLLYTAGWSTTSPTFSLKHSPIGYLTYPVWTFYDFPVKSASYLALEAAMLLIILVIALIALAHLLRHKLSKNLPQSL